MRYRRCGWRPVDPATGVRSDQTIRLTGLNSSRRYPVPLRHIHYFDAEKDWICSTYDGTVLAYIPNNGLSASTSSIVLTIT